MASRQDESSAADRVIDAAVECIVTEGFYRASSNSIARRAGVTWGVIQHHFGSRESLLLAVFERAVDRMDELFGGAQITGETVEERLEALADLMWSFYRQPSFLAYIQVVLNLAPDPRTADRTLEALSALTLRMSTHLPRLREQVLGSLPEAHEAFRFVFETMRGVAVNQQILRVLPNRSRAANGFQDADRRALISALAGYLRSVGVASQTTGDGLVDDSVSAVSGSAGDLGVPARY